MDYCERFTGFTLEELQVSYEYYDYRIGQGWGLFRIAQEHEMRPQWGNTGAITERYVIEQLALEWRELRKGVDSK